MSELGEMAGRTFNLGAEVQGPTYNLDVAHSCPWCGHPPDASLRRRVYVAGPITKGDRYLNIHTAIMAGRDLVQAGLAPLVPHLTCFMDPNDFLTWEAWLAVDEAFIVTCAAVLRLPGESKGADRETAFAQDLGIPIFHSVEEVVTWATSS